MVKAILSDLSFVVLFPKDKNYHGSLNTLHAHLGATQQSYTFDNYFMVNEELLHFYEKLRSQFSVNMFTKGTVQNTPQLQQKLRPVFEHIYSAAELGLNRLDPQAYKTIASLLNMPPEEIVLIDDQDGYLQAAKAAGMQTIAYINNAQVIGALSNLGVM